MTCSDCATVVVSPSAWDMHTVYKAAEARLRPEFVLPRTCCLEFADYSVNTGRRLSAECSFDLQPALRATHHFARHAPSRRRPACAASPIRLPKAVAGLFQRRLLLAEAALRWRQRPGFAGRAGLTRFLTAEAYLNHIAGSQPVSARRLRDTSRALPLTKANPENGSGPSLSISRVSPQIGRPKRGGNSSIAAAT
jgi:hypothetical protein